MAHVPYRERLTPPFWVAMGIFVVLVLVGALSIGGVLPRDPAMFAVWLLLLVGIAVPALMLKLNKRWGDIARRSRDEDWRNFHVGTGWRRWVGLPPVDGAKRRRRQR